MIKIFKKARPFYGSIYGILVLCVCLGQMQGILALVEPQIASLIVDKVVKPSLGEPVSENSSIFNFLIDGIPEGDIWSIMWVLVIAFIVFMGLYFLCFYIRWNIAHYYSLKCDNNMRLQVMKKINSFGQRLMKDYSSGDLITIVNSDSHKLRNFHIATIPFIVDSIFYIIFASYFLFRINIWLMILPLATLVIFGFITKGFLKMCNDLYGKLWSKNSALNTETQESIYGIRTIKAYGREDVRKERFSEKTEDLREVYTTFGTKRYKYFLAFGTVDQFVMVGSMAISIYLATHFHMTAGEYTAFLAYLLSICGYFVDIIFLSSDIQDAKVSADRLFGLLDKEDEILASYGDKMVSKTPHVEVKNLMVNADEEALIKGINLDIPYGKKIGIMGKTGSGKSVILRTLQAFKEYAEGEITIDGVNIKEYNKNEIARAYGYAMQDVFLFSNSIEANIAYYNPDASQEEVFRCGKIAEVDEFANDFPDKYKTIVGEKGFGLSGGQKQRVAIARALLKDAPITILDDCTSALDIETESKIFKNLNEYFNGRTLIMATHRAKALKDFDEIIFMEQGEIVERGTFNELMKLNGHYASIYNQQMDKEVYVNE